jgi:hypothetical protein
MTSVNLGYGEELILRCKNNGGIPLKRKMMELTESIVVNVECSPPDEISTPQTFREAMLAGDLHAIPSAGHMLSGVTTKYLPVSHLRDGKTPNPARMRMLRQRSLERERALANMTDAQLATYKEKISQLTYDPRLKFAEKKGLLDVYNASIKAKKAQQKAKKATFKAKKTALKAKKALEASVAAGAAGVDSPVFSWSLKGGRRRKSRKKRKSRRGKSKLGKSRRRKSKLGKSRRRKSKRTRRKR